MSRHLHRAALRFPRTLDDAFKGPRYGAAITYYTRPPLWRRVVSAIVRWL
jgi:hypothetical protein